MHLARWTPALLACIVAACSLLKDLDALEGDAGPDASQREAGSTVEAGADADASASASADTGSDAHSDATVANDCPATGRGPVMVSTTLGFCIDSTEVTVAQYRDFVVAKDGDTSGQDPRCTANAAFTAGALPGSGQDQRPIKDADFCDALAFCTWSGKHLCRGRDGSALAPTDVDLKTNSEWYVACSHDDDGAHRYPYGNAVDPAACNGKDRSDAGDAPLDVASLDTCQGGYPGIYDLGGNVYEWEDDCEPAGDGGVSCATRGGSYVNSAVNFACSRLVMVDSTDTNDSLGFRCCAGP